jgi:putative ABC transport system permease protein
MSKMAWISFLFSNSIRSLFRSPRRTLISLLSIASAAAAMLVFQAFANGIGVSFRFNVIRSIYAHYEISVKGFENDDQDNPFAYQMTNNEEIKREIEKNVGPVEFFGRRQKFYALLNYNDRSFGGVGWGIDAKAEKDFLTLMQVKEGVHLADSDEQSIFVAKGLAERLRLKVGDSCTILATTSRGSMNALDLIVTGIYQTGITELDGNTFLVHHGTASKLLDVEGAHQILVGFKDDRDLEYKAPLEDLIKTKFPTLQARHWRERAVFYDNSMAWINQQILVFKIIVLLISSLSIVNVFTMGLMERTGEFGTLRAIGTHRREVGAMIFSESLMQAVVGCIGGFIIAWVIIVVFLHNGITMPPPPLLSVPFHINFTFPWQDLAPIMILCTLVSGGAGIFPALRISRMNIVAALGRNV